MRDSDRRKRRSCLNKSVSLHSLKIPLLTIVVTQGQSSPKRPYDMEQNPRGTKLNILKPSKRSYCPRVYRMRFSLDYSEDGVIIFLLFCFHQALIPVRFFVKIRLIREISVTKFINETVLRHIYRDCKHLILSLTKRRIILIRIF